jgi:branched-chain amino acid aminotransferase
MLPDLQIQRVAKSRLAGFERDAHAYGDSVSEHLFTMAFDGERWIRPSVEPYAPIRIDPSAISLQYAQTVFEGLKAYRGVDGTIRLFRPERNASRLRASCARLCMPAIEDALFLDAITALVRVDADWVPRREGCSLYIRPIVTATDGYIGVRPSRRFLFLILTTPVGTYFRDGGKGLRLKVEEHYARAPAEGGLGAAKAAANYAASLLAGRICAAEGFDQVLWLDAKYRRRVEEAGLMNVFFVIGGVAVTPPLGDSILPGVTRESVLVLLKDRGVAVEERPIDIQEVAAAAHAGKLDEMFACGTAAVVSPIAALGYRGGLLRPRAEGTGALTRALYEELTGIQFGRLPDRHRWTRPIAIEAPAEPTAA